MMVALIGAGPLGLEIAVALKQAGVAYVQIEGGQVGATMQWWAPGTRWFSSNERISIAGVPLVTPLQEKATREEYLAYLRGIVEQFGLKVRTYTKVEKIEKEGEGFVLTLRHALVKDAPVERLRVEKVILATGGTAVPNMLGIEGEEMAHVSHYFQDPHMYFQKRLLIVGGRNSAVEAALRCYRAGAEVHFSYRGAGVDAKDIKYWLYPEFSSLVKAGKIVGHFGTCPKRITATTVELARATKGAAGAEVETLAVDFVLLMTGYLADLSLMEGLGVRLEGDQRVPAYDAATMETNVPGVYVAGTAIAGTQRRYKVFLENCHVHVGRIVAHLTGRAAPGGPVVPVFERPES